MAMSTGRHAFKRLDAARLIRATVAAGLKVKNGHDANPANADGQPCP
jgi:hypothetical protein